MKNFFKYFFRGLIFVTPIGVIVLLVVSLSRWIETQIEESHLQWYALIGAILAIIIGLFVLGYIGSTLLLKPIRRFFGHILKKIPIINLVYTSLSDLMQAFVGDKKKFDRPVIVEMNPLTHEERIGFITQVDLDEFDIKDKVAVYFPLSYSFSGTMSIFPKESVKPLPLTGAQTMKFIISGGLTGVEDEEEETATKKVS